MGDQRARVQRLPWALGTLFAAIFPGAGFLFTGSPQRAWFLTSVSAFLVLLLAGIADLPVVPAFLTGFRPGPIFGALLVLAYAALGFASVRRYRAHRFDREAPTKAVETEEPLPELRHA